MAGVMQRLLSRYLELEEAASRPAVSTIRRERVGSARGPRRPGPPDVLVKKLDLDLALEEVYERFFGQG